MYFSAEVDLCNQILSTPGALYYRKMPRINLLSPWLLLLFSLLSAETYDCIMVINWVELEDKARLNFMILGG